MPADVVNLNKFRKTKARGEKDKRAEENRAKFGRSKIERAKDADDKKRREALLDGAKLRKKNRDCEDRGGDET